MRLNIRHVQPTFEDCLRAYIRAYAKETLPTITIGYEEGFILVIARTTIHRTRFGISEVQAQGLDPFDRLMIASELMDRILEDIYRPAGLSWPPPTLPGAESR